MVYGKAERRTNCRSGQLKGKRGILKKKHEGTVERCAQCADTRKNQEEDQTQLLGGGEEWGRRGRDAQWRM